MRRAAVVLAALVLAAPALASEERPTLSELEGEVMCPTCDTTLDQSSSPIANRMRAFVRERIEAGDSKSEIKAALVDEFGEQVLASPPKRGFNLLAWVLPLVALVAGALVLAVAARRWSRSREPAAAAAPAAPLDADLERRVDEELRRFDA
jgi:cytochrome c-type biogenesis protein CcmH